MGKVEEANVENLDSPYLASNYGGQVPVRIGKTHKSIPEISVYRVRFEVTGGNLILPNRIAPGGIRILGRKRRFAELVQEQVAAVLIRESGV